jgi:hypothetical protein
MLQSTAALATFERGIYSAQPFHPDRGGSSSHCLIGRTGIGETGSVGVRPRDQRDCRKLGDATKNLRGHAQFRNLRREPIFLHSMPRLKRLASWANAAQVKRWLNTNLTVPNFPTEPRYLINFPIELRF